MGCPGCGRFFHEECETNCENCHGEQDRVVKSITNGSMGAPIKDPDKVTDRFSTGRKRAAVLYPIFKDKPCDWRGKKNVGGGHGIVGCINGMQQHRHHGPIKDTLRNDPENIHRICTKCHSRWHAVNDPLYSEEEYEDLPHSPEDATDIELLTADAEWRLKR
jgi:hypothetical protein